MKNLPLLITAGIVILCVGSYFLYDHFLAKRPVTPWDLIPDNTVAVYEPGSCTECIETARSSPLWEVLKRAAFYGGVQDSLKNLFVYLNTPNPGSLASLHVTKKDDFDFVFYVPMGTEAERNLFEGILEDFKKKNRKYFQEREYNDVKIQELSFSGHLLSWVTLENIWIASFTPFLVEDVIRVHGRGQSTFRNKLGGVYQLPNIKKDAGNFYIFLPKIAEWLSVFSENIKENKSVTNLYNASLLDIKPGENSLVLNGFTLNLSGAPSVLSVFTEQNPTSFDIKQYVSNRTMVMMTCGISDGEKFEAGMSSHPMRRFLQDTLRQLNTSLGFDLKELYKAIDNEVGICYVESQRQKLSTILLIEASQPEIWMRELNKLSDRLSVDTVFYEPYAGYEIREVPLYKLPEKIFSPFISGFDHCYYTSLGKYVLIGENLEDLKLFLDDIDREETWGKSVAQNKFLESALLESNLGVYINTPLVWNFLSRVVNPKWKQFIAENKQLLGSLGMGAIQFSNLNESFYTNILWQVRDRDNVRTRPKAANSTLTFLNNGILSRPHIGWNHTDKNYEVLLQDSSHQVYLVAADGKVLWSVMVSGPITGEVSQIDYFANGKLQYLFATLGELHVIDRLGNYVDPYPVSISAREIEYVNVVDYDHSRNYRFLIGERSGKIWMYDKNGLALEGWNPQSAVDGSLFTYARHHRVRGKDYIVAMERDGTVYIFNRRGELLNGFPLELNARPLGNYFLDPGNSTADTKLVIVSRDGFRITFNLEGKVLNREVLIKTALESQFSLIAEKNGKSYRIVRQDKKRIDILDQDGNDLIGNEFVGPNAVEVQYFDFGGGNIYYTITDQVQDISFVYDEQGKLITSPPIESYSINLKSTEQYKVNLYYTYHNSLAIRPLY